jgi:dTDP-4-amino-4,6-dideoxygalactose transaminase
MKHSPIPFEAPLYVTRPLLPPLESLTDRLREVWDAKWLTNDGAQSRQLEKDLAAYLRISEVTLAANATLGLILACRALALSGEVIVTPFTFPATVHALAWAGLTPVFADIDPETMGLDPISVERAVTPATSGIFAVHVYGIPCDVKGLASLANRHGLKIVYDAAHAFGVEVDGQPVVRHGNLSVLSFHATKLFHTAEGGALVSADPELRTHLEFLRNFGIRNEFEVPEIGINAKMSELHAALGVETLKLVDLERSRRAAIARQYRDRLGGHEAIAIPDPGRWASRQSYQYFPVRVLEEAGRSRQALYDGLKQFNIFSRQYFFPLCSDIQAYCHLPSAAVDNLPNARRAARECLCLPFHGGLDADAVDRICDAVLFLLDL